LTAFGANTSVTGQAGSLALRSSPALFARQSGNPARQGMLAIRRSPARREHLIDEAKIDG
jgi:hypothetical protein